MTSTTLQRLLWTVTGALACIGAGITLLSPAGSRTAGIGVQVAALTLAVATYALQEHAHRHTTVALRVDHLEVHQ